MVDRAGQLLAGRYALRTVFPPLFGLPPLLWKVMAVGLQRTY
ncbi:MULTISPECIES: hypothetical protein [Acinetobacter calcoaceticus/baumannii complex]